MSDDENKNAWMSVYAILKEVNQHDIDDYSFDYFEQFFIVDKASNEKVHGPYRDYVYAKKQARRKYKKLVRNMERALMS